MEDNVYKRKILIEKTKKLSFSEMVNDLFDQYTIKLKEDSKIIKIYNDKYKLRK
jgi:hypothetical protein